MAVTVTKEKVFVVGDRKRVIGTILFDSSYPTGGESVTAANFGLDTELNDVQVHSGAGYLAEWDQTNKKVLMYRQTAATGALAQVPNTTDLSAVTVRFEATGKGPAVA